MLDITVVFAKTNHQTVLKIKVSIGMNIQNAIAISNIENLCSDMDLNKCSFSIWGEKVPENYQLQDGDRIEICRGLTSDPKTLRRKRAMGKYK